MKKRFREVYIPTPEEAVEIEAAWTRLSAEST
jgi:hypothetical protein